MTDEQKVAVAGGAMESAVGIAESAMSSASPWSAIAQAASQLISSVANTVSSTILGIEDAYNESERIHADMSVKNTKTRLTVTRNSAPIIIGLVGVFAVLGFYLWTNKKR